MNEPFGKLPDYIRDLTDAQAYDWHFRKYDKEADAADLTDALEVIDGEKSEAERKAEYVALCRSFGHSEQQAEAEWQKWLKEQ